jgi:lipopolysaccharide transport system ATP-binding protein
VVNKPAKLRRKDRDARWTKSHSSSFFMFSGTSDQVIERYAQLTSRFLDPESRNWGKGRHTTIRDVRLRDKNDQATSHYVPGEPLRLDVIIETDGTAGMSLELFLVDAARVSLGMASTYQFQGQTIPQKEGTYRVRLNLGPLLLATGRYGFDVRSSVVNIGWDHCIESAVEFDVHFSNPLGLAWDFKQSFRYGSIVLLSDPTPEFVSA